MTSPVLPPDPRIDRRRALSGVAVATVGVPLLAACAGPDSDGAEPAADTGEELISTADVPEGGGVVLGDAGVVVTQPRPGEYKAFNATCTHQGCPVTGVSETIDCVCHGSKFSITDGSVVQGPATAPLSEEAITVDGGRITLG